jgi:hypothetical protein
MKLKELQNLQDKSNLLFAKWIFPFCEELFLFSCISVLRTGMIIFLGDEKWAELKQWLKQ